MKFCFGILTKFLYIYDLIALAETANFCTPRLTVVALLWE
jgi:hypothetical protein